MACENLKELHGVHGPSPLENVSFSSNAGLKLISISNQTQIVMKLNNLREGFSKFSTLF